MSAAPRMSFTGLWPTMLIRRRLPGFAQPNEGLATHILGEEARERDYTARYQEQNFFAVAKPPVCWLESQIHQTVKSFLQQVGVARIPEWSLFAWYNVNRLGDHHAPHTHPKSYLSGTYYVRVPPAPTNADDPRTRHACISFYDPRTGANMVTTGSEPDARAAHTVLPAAGTLLMWPSPVQHQVHPNLSDELRISISFNVIVPVR